MEKEMYNTIKKSKVQSSSYKVNKAKYIKQAGKAQSVSGFSKLKTAGYGSSGGASYHNVRGAPTKGLIKNCTSGDIQEFQFNPDSFSYSRGVTYATIEAPGMAYPETQFVKGNIREFSVLLRFWDKPYTGVYVQKCNFLGGFLTPETNVQGYTKPPEMLFVFGAWVRRCVMVDLDINTLERDGNLNPTRFECTLRLRQVGVE